MQLSLSEVEREATQPNLLIHGENLAVLSTLPAQSIDFMLWDPPYNIGAKAYQDKRRDWSAFMCSRLEAAKPLFKESGGVGVYIDESELESLLRIMREVFGKKNFLANIVWKAHKGGSSD